MATDPRTRTPDLSGIRTVAEAVLVQTWGRPARLGEGVPLRDRTSIFRFAVQDGPAEAPATVVVKTPTIRDDATYDPANGEPGSPAWRLFNDWAGLQFLATLDDAPALAPRFYGGDRAAGLIVIEDLGDGAHLDHLLLGADPVAAADALVALATTLGRMHAATLGRQAEFARLRGVLGPPAPEDYAGLGAPFRDIASRFAVPAAPGLDAELAEVEQVVTDPGPFLAYTHGDPCPDNCLPARGTLRLIDFEVGAFRHALLDGVYGCIHFPTCWCVNRLPPALPPAMEAAYRAELVRGCPAAADDTLFGRAVVAACAYWVLRQCQQGINARILYEEDREWGIATVRQRLLLRLDILAHLTAETGYLEACGATAAGLATALRGQWPTAADAMPVYPAFGAPAGPAH